MAAFEIGLYSFVETHPTHKQESLFHLNYASSIFWKRLNSPIRLDWMFLVWANIIEMILSPLHRMSS